jgi:hypothetical protein
MIRNILGLGFAVLLAASAGQVAAQEMKHDIRTTPAFDQLKSLAGQWQGKDTSGNPVTLEYSVVSNGSAVMEKMMESQKAEMVTMYTLDGDRILVTHYCAAGNQPTMETTQSPSATGKYDFAFVRVSGTKTPDEAHMASLSLSIPDNNHLKQVWTFDDHGKSKVETMTYERTR